MNAFINILIAKLWLLSVIVFFWNLDLKFQNILQSFVQNVLSSTWLFILVFKACRSWNITSSKMLLYFLVPLVYCKRACHFWKVLPLYRSLLLIFIAYPWVTSFDGQSTWHINFYKYCWHSHKIVLFSLCCLYLSILPKVSRWFFTAMYLLVSYIWFGKW